MLHFGYNYRKKQLLGKKIQKQLGTVFGFIAGPDGQ